MHGQCFWHLLLPRMWAIIITILILMLMTLLKMQLRAFAIYLNWTLFGTFKLTIIWKMTIIYVCNVALQRIVFFSPPPPSSSLHSVQQMDPFKAREDQMDQSRLLLPYHSIYIANDKQGCFCDCMSCTVCTKVHHKYTSYDELLSVAILRSWELF